MSEPRPHAPRDHQFDEVQAVPGGPLQRLKIEDLRTVRMGISADLGSCTMLVRDVLELQRGSVISLDKLAGEMTDIFVNGLHLARGEVVVIGDSLHVRIGEITGGEIEERQQDEE